MASALTIEASPVTFSVKGSRSKPRPDQQSQPTSPRSQAVRSPRAVPDPRLSDSQVDSMLRDCLKTNRRGIEEAFQSVDPLNEGSINTSDFERVIDHFFFPLSKVQHSQLVDRVGLHLDGTLDYDHFIAFLSENEAPPKKKFNVHKKADRALNRPLPQQLSEAEVEASVRHAIVHNGDKMMRAFRLHDRTGGLGRIRRDDFCQVLNSFVMVMTKEQFDRLWNAHDTIGDGFMYYEMFVSDIAGSGVSAVRAGGASRKGVKPHVDRTGLAEVGQRIVANPEALPLQHVENHLRKLMKKKLTDLQEALRNASDNGDGFVTRSQLKKAVDTVIMPIDGEVFEGLLLSVGLSRTARTVPYEDFIRRFLANEDRAVLADAVTDKAPGSDGHVVGPDKGMDLQTILAILRRDIPVGSGALLAKFVKNDADRTGLVSAFELRSILGSYNVHLPDPGFRCLMELLDPRGKGMLRYHEFLENFAPTVEEGKKKWMNDVNNYNRARAAEDLTFKQFKNVLQDKMRAKGKPLSELFLDIDTNQDGTISPDELRHFLEENYLSSSSENFQRLWQMCDTNRDGRIQFSEFLAAMGLDVNPGDLTGVSHRVVDASQMHAARRQEDHKKRMKTISEKSGEEVRVSYQLWQKAKRTLQQKADSGQLRSAFSAFDSDHDGELSLHELVEMFQHLKVVEDDEIMDCALANVGEKIREAQIPALFNSNPFVVDEASAQSRPPVRSSARPPAGTKKQKANETPLLFKRESKRPAASTLQSGKVTLRAEEIADRLREMVQLKFADMHSAFRKFDGNLDGSVNRKEFQKVLVDFHFKLDKAELEKLLTHIGMKADDAVLRYEDFLQFFGAREGSDAHRFLASTHRYNIAIEPSKMSAKEAAKQLPFKVADAFKTVHEAYRAVDQSGTHEVKRSGLKKLLERFNIPMTDTEFEKLWRTFDTNDDGDLQVDEFFASLGMEVTSTDTGASQMISEESEIEQKRHRDDQRDKMATISEHHQQAAQRMPATDIGNQMKWKMEQERKTLHQIARAADVNDDAVLSRQELLQILQARGFDINVDKLEKVLELIGLEELDLIPYRDFMDAFSDTKQLGGDVGGLSPHDAEVADYTNQASAQSRHGATRSVLKRPAAPTPLSKPHAQVTSCHEGMEVDEFLPVVRQQVVGQQQRLREQLLRADGDRTGLIECRLLKSALTAHCAVKLTPRQIQVLVEKTLSGHRGKVSYNHFLDFFDVPVCTETANKITGYAPSTGGGGSRQGRHVTPQMSRSEQRLQLPAVPGVSGRDRSPRPYKTHAAAAAKDLSPAEAKLKLPMIQESPARDLDASNKIQPILNSIRRCVQGKIKELQRAFRRLDPRRSGLIPTHEFRALLKSYGVELSSNQLFRLQDAFDTGSGSLQKSSINYEQFLSTCF